MALKKKLKSFITDIRESTGKSPEEETLPTQLIESPAVAKFKEHLADANDPQADRELVESIEDAYFSDPSFDASQYELDKLPDTLESQQIDHDRKTLKKQLQALSRKVSELVLENHPAYAAELQRVMELQNCLHTAAIVCANGRRQLGSAQQGFTTASLGLLANYRKRQQLVTLLHSLSTIKTLQRTDVRLREMLEEEDYPGAIQLCLECITAAHAYRHFHCISELSSKLQDTLEMIEESLDVALSKTCSGFEQEHYEKVQRAYQLLGKTQTAMDQLHMHFTSAIHNTAFQIVLGYVELCSGQPGQNNFQKRSYADLCKFISPEVFTACLIDLSKALWEVMRSYHHTMLWHQQNDRDREGNGTAEGSDGTAQGTGGEDGIAGGTGEGNGTADGSGDTNVTASSNGGADETASNNGGAIRAAAGAEAGAVGGTNDPSEEESMSREYIRQKLWHGLARVWSDVQQKVKLFLLSTDLSGFKYDDFIHVLDIVNRLIQIGCELCGSESEALQESIRKQSLNYFHNYHRARLEELRMFLENEGWELCPVKSSFSILMLQEFKFMRQKHLDSSVLEAVVTPDDRRPAEGYFVKYATSGNPFDPAAISGGQEEDREEDVMDTTNGVDEELSDEQTDSEDDGPENIFGYPGEAGRTFSQDSDSDDDIPDELKQDFIDEQTGEVPQLKKQSSLRRRKSREKLPGKQGPIVTNTTINVCRLFGKYIQMMAILKPIAFDVTICMSQLFDYYLYAIFCFFGVESEDEDMAIQCLSPRLRATILRITDRLISSSSSSSSGPQQQQTPTPASPAEEVVGRPRLSPMVDLASPSRLYGLGERVVATESLVFLAKQFEFLQGSLEALIPASRKAFLQQFYSQTVSVAGELRRPVYHSVASQAVDYARLQELMATVRFDPKELMSQHSHYVDVMLQALQAFQNQLGTLMNRTAVPKPVTHVLWEHCIQMASRTLVEGYSSAKKCSNEGRALMQLDYQQFLIKLEKLTDLRPIPGREYVEQYIKAYYLPEAQLEIWIREHKEYSVRQVVNLVNCVPHLNKKARQRLTGTMEEITVTTLVDKMRR